MEILKPPPQAQSAELTPHPPSVPLPPAGWKAPGEKARFAQGREGDGNREVLVPALNLPLLPSSCSCIAVAGGCSHRWRRDHPPHLRHWQLLLFCTPHHWGASSAQNCQEGHLHMSFRLEHLHISMKGSRTPQDSNRLLKISPQKPQIKLTGKQSD